MSETSNLPSAIAPLPPSPCVGVCTLKGDFCYGCGRTSDEIAAWGQLPPADQSAIWAELPARLAAFGFKTFRLAAGPAVVAAFLARTFRETTGRWRLVSASLEGAMAITHVARPALSETRDAVVARSSTGELLTLLKHEKVRVFGFSSGDPQPRMDTVALVLPKGLAQRALADAVPPPHAKALDIASVGALAWRLPSGGVMLRNGIGSLATDTPVFAEAPIAPDANAPADLKISKAFIACAIFHADDPQWLAAALAP